MMKLNLIRVQQQMQKFEKSIAFEILNEKQRFLFYLFIFFFFAKNKERIKIKKNIYL